MELDNRLLNDIRKIDQKAARENLYYAEEPDWMIYEERKREDPLNKYRGVYDTADERSINKAPSIYDKGTIFRTDTADKK